MGGGKLFACGRAIYELRPLCRLKAYTPKHTKWGAANCSLVAAQFPGFAFVQAESLQS
jgi:hypothetical protein